MLQQEAQSLTYFIFLHLYINGLGSKGLLNQVYSFFTECLIIRTTQNSKIMLESI